MNSIGRMACGLAVALLAGAPLWAADRKEGGYVGTYDEGHDAVVYNFLKHFSYQQYYYSQPFQFASSNNARVDAMDIAIFAGHGNRWYISTTNGGVDLANVGSGASSGWGDVQAEFVVFESCYVVPSPIEVSDWWTNWIKTPNGAFDGVHQVLSFHTVSWQSTDQDVTDFFGSRMHGNHAVWQSWFDAINSEGRSDEFGAAVMHPSTDGDRYATFVADPPKNHQSLRLWYQY